MARRLEAVSADPGAWPRAAREELARAERRAERTAALSQRLQNELDAVAAQSAADAVAAAKMQVVCLGSWPLESPKTWHF